MITTKKQKFIGGRKKLIKETVEERMALYNRLCAISDFLLNKYSPCNFKDCKCDGLDGTTCCIGCKYLEDGVGCTTKALQCKLYLCYDVREGHLHETLSKLQSIASMNGLIHYREGTEYTENFLRSREISV